MFIIKDNDFCTQRFSLRTFLRRGHCGVHACMHTIASRQHGLKNELEDGRGKARVDYACKFNLQVTK